MFLHCGSFIFEELGNLRPLPADFQKNNCFLFLFIPTTNQRGAVIRKFPFAIQFKNHLYATSFRKLQRAIGWIPLFIITTLLIPFYQMYLYSQVSPAHEVELINRTVRKDTEKPALLYSLVYNVILLDITI